MKKYILVIILVLFFSEINAQIPNKFISRETTFKVGEIVFIFGDKVRLKENPSKESKEIDLLKIGSQVKILEKTAVQYPYNGKSWYWYKVKTKNKVGYVVGGLLSLDTKVLDNSMYLVSLKKEADGYKIITRLYEGGKRYKEQVNDFATKGQFTTEIFHNRGVEGIKNMLFINYQAQVSNINKGGYYLFNDKGSLIKAIELKSVSDGGNGTLDKIVFPEDEEGIIGKILFSREVGGIVPNQNNSTRTSTTIESCEFVWQGKELKLEPLTE